MWLCTGIVGSVVPPLVFQATGCLAKVTPQILICHNPVCVSVCVCVCKRERESVCVCERERTYQRSKVERRWRSQCSASWWLQKGQQRRLNSMEIISPDALK